VTIAGFLTAHFQVYPWVRLLYWYCQKSVSGGPGQLFYDSFWGNNDLSNLKL